ncbi:hypothetical protein [Xenorhabdus bovienii]|uniref:hypothetical protein n=1 Tax=Xenorhabdus bovienii TaxID=40576 RepID=UPI00237C999C|nr:hypothetical protein [Xenorhabdus bovienii]MDE1475909.1 hypothetical protein [Xenorhabdus bovienii]MDE9463104.1 hypothetical protein [Xenorhabdus bovienii]
MGADIHWSFQKETVQGWEDIEDHFSGWRNYQLFAWLGLESRNDGSVNSICELRGLPEDIAQDFIEVYGEHSYSWLMSNEILHVPLPQSASKIVIEFIEEVKRLNELHGNVRFVFGFDS